MAKFSSARAILATAKTVQNLEGTSVNITASGTSVTVPTNCHSVIFWASGDFRMAINSAGTVSNAGYFKSGQVYELTLLNAGSLGLAVTSGTVTTYFTWLI